MQVLKGIGKGLRIFVGDDDTKFADFLIGDNAPIGTAGETDEAPIGSEYKDLIGGGLYQKKFNTSSASDWVEIGSGSLQLGFRKEKIRVITGEAITPGVRNLTSTPFTDDDGAGIDATNFTVGEFIIGTAGGTAVLLEATVVAAPNVTFAVPVDPVANPALAEFDNFITPNYLPDPVGQEGQALVQINGAGNAVKIGDVDWAFATGIALSGGYASAAGVVAAGNSVELAIEKLDGNQKNIYTALGIVQGDTEMGAYPGGIITDDVPQTTVNTELEAAIEKISLQKNGVLVQNVAVNTDSYDVDEFQTATWVIVARDTANPARVKRLEIQQIHNGHGAADATISRESRDEKVNIGNVNLQIDTVLTGVGAAQQVHLELETNEASGISYTVERINFLPLAG